ncbi:MAG TPA: hypothetical protein EYQ09_02695, partial [Flavobacteriales bacterium]|nr:hypothetical protein [Flavobacteriales bacterium]
MLIKNNSIGLKTTALVLTVLILSFFTLNSEKLKTEKEDFIQYIMSKDLGFSNRVNLVDTGEGIFHNENASGFSKYKEEIIRSLVNAIPKIIQYKINGNEVKRIDIDIKFTDLQKINSDKQKAIKNGVLHKPTTVNAKIRFEGSTYKARLRLKGDLAGHWTSKYRNSFRIGLKNKRTILGFNKFSIQKPGERQFPYDYVFQSMMKNVGNLSSTHNFANVYVNGTDWGIMNIEEHMSKELLEKQKRKESIIIRFSNEDKWLYDKSANSHSDYRLSDPILFVKLYGSKKYLKNYTYRKLYSYVLKQHMAKNVLLYDIDKFTKSYIMAMAWGDFHTLLNFNSRYYFSPYTLRLEPITTDASSFAKLSDIEKTRFFEPKGLYSTVLNSPNYKTNLANNLFDISNSIQNNLQKYFDTAGSIFPVDKKKSAKIVKDNLQKIIDSQKKYLIDPIEKYSSEVKLDNTSTSTRQLALPTKQQASEFSQHLHIRHYTDGTLELYNLIPDNVIVKDILYNGLPISIEDTVIPSYLSDQKLTIIKTPYKGIQDGMFTINTEYQGFDKKVKNNITLVSDGIDNPLLLNTAGEFDFINKLDGSTYEIKQGN